MKRMIGKALSVLGVALATQGCTDEESSLFVAGNIIPNPGDCSFSTDASGQKYLSGVLDVGLRLQYDAALLVGNQLTPRGDKENLRTETMLVSIQGAEVRLTNDDGSLIDEFTVPATGVIQPVEGAGAGFDVVSFSLIPASTGVALAERLEGRGRGGRVTVVSETRVFGQTIGGDEIESASFFYIVEACDGCLVDFQADYVTLGSDGVLRCDTANAEDVTRNCTPGQDQPVDCRACALSGNPLCVSPNAI